MFMLLLLLFTLVPLVEVGLLWQLQAVMGWPMTLLVVLATGMLGAWLAKLQGFLALNQVRGNLVQGQLPPGTVVNGVLILVAGIVLITPGVLTDIVGLLLLIPPVRKVVGKGLTSWLSKRVQVTTNHLWAGMAQAANDQAANRNPDAAGSAGSTTTGGRVIDARVVETRVEE